MRLQLLLPRLLLLSGLLGLSACGFFDQGGVATLVTATATAAPVAVEEPQHTPLAAESNGVDDLNTTLIIWTTADISPRSEVAGGSALTEQLNAFDASHPNLSLEVQLKTVTGPGGILNYLRYGQDVAPSILPDIILLPTDQLAVATQAELIYPLESIIEPALVADLFPAANSLARVDNVLMGYPFALEQVSHLVYDSSTITTTLATTWPEFVLSDARLIFPAGTDDGQLLALQYYEALDGTLVNEAGQPNLQLEPLTQLLTDFNQAREDGVVIFQSSNAASLSEAWGVYQNGTANVVLTNSRFFLSQRGLGGTNEVAAIPGPAAPLAPFVNGWVWSVSTADPARQALALELIGWLANPENLNTWSQQSLLLPARRSAFALWPEEDAYISFLQGELERAVPLPATATPAIRQALGDALFNVISLAQTPDDAARAAVNTIRP